MPADGKVFVDTNVWVYAHLQAPGDARHSLALQRLRSEPDIVISPQVVAEYYSVMLRNGQPDDWIQGNLQAMFACSRLQPADAGMLATALTIRQRYGFSFWDCQIVAAALTAGCDTLLTEDLQHGQRLEGRLTIINPFQRTPLDN